MRAKAAANTATKQAAQKPSSIAFCALRRKSTFGQSQSSVQLTAGNSFAYVPGTITFSQKGFNDSGARWRSSAPAAWAGFFGGGALLWRLLAVVRCGHFAAFFGGPPGFGGLAAAREAEGIRRNVLRNRGTGGNVGAVADFYRRNENGIASDKNAIADDRGKFIHAVVIAGNRSGADVGVRAQFGVADVTQVRNFAALADDRFFRLDKVSNARAFFQMGSRTNAREWPDRIAAIEMAFEDHRVRFDSDAIAENGVVQDAAGANRAVGAEFCLAEQLHAGLDEG